MYIKAKINIIKEQSQKHFKMEYIVPTIHAVRKVCKQNDDIKCITCNIEIRYQDPCKMRVTSSGPTVEHFKMPESPRPTKERGTFAKQMKDQGTQPKPSKVTKDVGTSPNPIKTKQQSTSTNVMKEQSTSPLPPKPTKDQGTSVSFMRNRATSSTPAKRRVPR